MVPEIADTNRFAVDLDGYYCINKVFTINLDVADANPFYLAALLNSSTLSYYFTRTGKRLHHGFFEYAGTYLATMPVRRVHFATPAEERTALVEEVKGMYWDWVGRQKKNP